MIRLLALYASQPTLPAGDEWDYVRRAVWLANGRSLVDDAARAPGPIYLYAAVFRLFQPWLLLAKGANVLLGSAVVLPIFYLGRSLGGVRVGLVAAALAAGYPTFIAFSHFLWSEPLYVFLLVSGVALLAWDLERPAVWKLAAAGFVLGLSALSKESGLLFPLLAVLYLAWQDRRQIGRAAVRSACLVGVFALTLLPWALEINRPGLPFALVTRTSYMNLYIGNHAVSTGHGMQQYPTLAPTRLEAEAVAREIALANIARRMPWWPLEKIRSEVPRFFTPTSFAVRRLLMPPGDEGNWGYRFRWSIGNRRGPRVAASAVVVASYVTVTLAGVVGLVLSRRRRLVGLF